MNKQGVANFSFSTNGTEFTAIGGPFTAKPGRWVGAKLGMFCTRNNRTNDAGFAEVDWFRINSEF